MTLVKHGKNTSLKLEILLSLLNQKKTWASFYFYERKTWTILYFNLRKTSACFAALFFMCCNIVKIPENGFCPLFFISVPVCCAGAGSLLGLHPGDSRLRLPEVSTEEPSHSLRRHRYIQASGWNYSTSLLLVGHYSQVSVFSEKQIIRTSVLVALLPSYPWPFFAVFVF